MIDKQILLRAHKWLGKEYDEDTRREVKRLIDTNETECIDAFYRDLEFGTGGLRGIMGVGTNRMNKYTIAKATQGLANYLKAKFKHLSSIKIAIAYDNRNNSLLFSKIIADVFSGNGLLVYLFEGIRTTPELSFAIRKLKAQSGIVVTASHNSKEYNGYKVYWDDGSQIIAPHDINIIKEVKRIVSLKQVIFAGNKANIHKIGREIDDGYFEAIKSLRINPQVIEQHRDLRIVYTPLHGTGITAVPQCLKLFGFEDVLLEPSQKISDSNFPTVTYPNPEEPAALKLAMEMARDKGADLVMATDPDTDRVGIAVREFLDSEDSVDNSFRLLNGNQTGSLIVYYLLKAWKDNHKIKNSEFIVKTIVTTRLIEEIATSFNVPCKNVLTGFKYISSMIRKKEGEKKFIAGVEESYGYLIGDFVRDKDAVGACCIIAEIAAFAKSQGKTLMDLLKQIYIRYGFFLESLVSVTKKGKNGAEEIADMMHEFRTNSPEKIDNSAVISIIDYSTGSIKNLKTGERKNIDLPNSNVIQFLTEDKSLVTARPSGTEPKIKFYFGVRGKLDEIKNFEQVEKTLKEKLSRLEHEFQQ